VSPVPCYDLSQDKLREVSNRARRLAAQVVQLGGLFALCSSVVMFNYNLKQTSSPAAFPVHNAEHHAVGEGGTWAASLLSLDQE
jgi:hypothetical protein